MRDQLPHHREVGIEAMAIPSKAECASRGGGAGWGSLEVGWSRR